MIAVHYSPSLVPAFRDQRAGRRERRARRHMASGRAPAFAQGTTLHPTCSLPRPCSSGHYYERPQWVEAVGKRAIGGGDALCLAAMAVEAPVNRLARVA
jgi:hypothetical protein